MFDKNFVGVWDLAEGDRVVTITKVEPGKVGGQNGRKADRKPIIHFRELDNPLACNVTNARTIAGMYGPDVRKWTGQKITLYPTTTTFGRETVECIRVRPTPPKGPPTDGPRSRPVDESVRARQDRAAGRADHPAAPLGAAENARDFLAAVRACARWINGNLDERLPKVLELAAKHGVEGLEVDAELAQGLDQAEAS